ncbi:PLP-dependent aminotransferase family protein [Ferrimonas balearica]|nr:PLP-dependent aminotransferase family protein [Ferrimonas balearica]
MAIPTETLFLDPESERTLQQQIQQLVADSILSGRFQPGEKMPSTRAFARHLKVARITVSLAYNELVANGFLVSRDRSGYFVADTAPRRPQFTAPAADPDGAMDWQAAIANPQRPPSELVRPPDWRSYHFPFIYGQSDPRLFDHQNWRLCAINALGRKDFEALTTDYYERDDPVLIEYLRRQLLPRRGISARPEEILLTMGAQNALWIATQLLLSSERTAAMENPGYAGLRDLLRQSRCRTHFVDIDEDGLPPEDIPRGIDAVFTTASHHCPTSVTMPLARRRDLLTRAREENFVVVEDDYEFELPSLRAPTPALKAQDRTGHVIYIGSFSKTLFPGLRMGYMVAPEPFIRQARSMRAYIMRHPPGHVQRTMAYFLSLGHFDAQLARMGDAFSRRRAVMEKAIEDVGLDLATPGLTGGSSFWLRAPAHVSTTDLAMRLREDSVVIEPGQAFFKPEEQNQQFYRLAYSSIATNRIPQGVELIGRAIAELSER